MSEDGCVSISHLYPCLYNDVPCTPIINQLFLAIFITYNWPLYQLDVQNAFLHGDLSPILRGSVRLLLIDTIWSESQRYVGRRIRWRGGQHGGAWSPSLSPVQCANTQSLSSAWHVEAELTRRRNLLAAGRWRWRWASPSPPFPACLLVLHGAGSAFVTPTKKITFFYKKNSLSNSSLSC